MLSDSSRSSPSSDDDSSLTVLLVVLAVNVATRAISGNAILLHDKELIIDDVLTDAVVITLSLAAVFSCTLAPLGLVIEGLLISSFFLARLVAGCFCSYAVIADCNLDLFSSVPAT
jgi:hypothetical protein